MSSFSFFSSSGKRKRDPRASQTPGGMDLESLRSLDNGGAGSDEHPPGWPFPGWTRYRFEAFLGKGAMGQVYQVFDPVLNRSVALKVLNERAMIHADRFLSEARAMARVDHPNVAKVFEVGTVEGRPYLTMQLLHGVSLHALRGKLGLEERVEMMRQACEGVQAAHRMGLLHRDLKPSNIVVEKDADDCWHAFVVDFGLACDTAASEPASEAKGLPEQQAKSALDEAALRIQARVELDGQDDPTATSISVCGNITGTPAFMSPEQAAGEALDRRSDVFSLGSTLYAILTGAAPFGGQSILSILGNVALTRPAPLKDFEGKFPQDLEAVVLKAMEKDPLRRYPSARALALELERWLNGEAVEAVQHKPFYRLGRWVRKNPSLAGLGVLLILTVTGAIGLGWRASWRARAQARYYQYFCQEAERMEAKLALAEVMPLHDTVPERQAIQAQMRELEKVMGRAGWVAEAPGRYALGRGYLVLEKWSQARNALEKAWALGLQTPEVASALGYCLNQNYTKELEGLSGKAFLERKQSLDGTLKPGILKYLAVARSGMQGPEMVFVEAQLAKAEGRLEEALLKADQVLKADSWNVRAMMLKAEILRTQAQDLALGAAPLEEAKVLLVHAGEIARSSASVHEKIASLYMENLKKAIAQRQPFMGYFQQTLDAANQALAANSQSSSAWGVQATAWWLSRGKSTEWFWAQNEDKIQLPGAMRQAIVCADRALVLEPNSIISLNAKGVAWWLLADWERWEGQDSMASQDKAVATFEEALRQLNQSVVMQINLASCYLNRGLRKKERGIDPLPDFQKAAEYYKLGKEEKSEAIYWRNLCVHSLELATFLWWQAKDPKDSLRAALEYAERIPAGSSTYDSLCYKMQTYQKMAEIAAWDGKPDMESSQRGAYYARQACALNARDPFVLEGMAKITVQESFEGGKRPDFKGSHRWMRQLMATRQGEYDYFYRFVWLILEEFRQKPSWRAYLALKNQVDRGAKLPGAKPELQLYGFEACRIALEKKAPGATSEQWRSRMKEHFQRAKQMNPLIAPLADKLLKERAGLQN